MGHALRYRVGQLTLHAIILILALSSVVSVIEPWPTIFPIPRFAGDVTIAVVLFGWIGVWLLVETWFNRFRWRRIGKAAGLTPEGGGPIVGPELAGRVSGREVRAISGSDVETVLTELPFEPAEGAIVGHLDEVYTGLELADHADYTDGNLAALASDGELAEAVLTGRPKEVLADAEHSVLVVAGTVSDAFASWDPDSNMVTYANGETEKIKQKMSIWHIFADRSEAKPGGTLLTDKLTAGGRQTVACVKFTNDAEYVRNGQELRERAEAATAVADAFEDAVSRPGDVDGQ